MVRQLLNLCIEADEKGIWEDFDVEIIGVDIDAINITEDREQFRELMLKIGIPMAPQATANSFLKGKEIAQEFGFPLLLEPLILWVELEHLLFIKKKILMSYYTWFGNISHP